LYQLYQFQFIYKTPSNAIIPSNTRENEQQSFNTFDTFFNVLDKPFKHAI